MCSKHVCPVCGNTESFTTSAHVVQTWKVDGNGNFLKAISTDDTMYGPDDGNIWTCTKCGADAVIDKS